MIDRIPTPYLAAVMALIAAGPLETARAQQGSATWQATLVVESSITAFEATTPAYAVVGANGRLYVGDTDGPQVLIVDASTAVAGRMGRDGEGPGEFRNIRALGVLPHGTWVYDARLSRVVTIDSRARLLETVRIPQSLRSREGGGGSFRLLGRVSKGQHLGESGPDPASLSGWAKGQPNGARALVLIDSTGGLNRVLGWMGASRCTREFPFAGTSTPLPVVFCTPPTTAASPDGAIGVIVEDLAPGQGRGAVRVHVADTRTGAIMVREVDIDRSPTTREERDSAVASILRQLPPVAELRDRYSELPVSEFKPGFRSVLVDDTRRVWLKVQQGASQGHRLVGVRARESGIVQVTLPPGVEPLAISGMDLWAVRTTDESEPVVQRFRLSAK